MGNTDNKNWKELIIDDVAYKTRLTKKYENRNKWKNPDKREVHSVIPGTVTEVFVKQGQQVEKGDPLMSLDAMKMLNILKAPHSGTVQEINVEKGQKISKNYKLFIIG